MIIVITAIQARTNTFVAGSIIKLSCGVLNVVRNFKTDTYITG